MTPAGTRARARATPAAARSGSSPSSASSTSSTAARGSSRGSRTSTSRTSRRATGFELDVAPELGTRRGADRGRARAGAGDRPARRTPVGVRPAGAGAQLRQPGVTACGSCSTRCSHRAAWPWSAPRDRAGSLGRAAGGQPRVFPGEVVARALRGVAARPRGPIDLAVVAVPAAAVPGVAADAAAAGVTAMVVLSGGFAETGPDGAALQEELLRRGRAGGRAPGARRRAQLLRVQNCDLPLNASIASRAARRAAAGSPSSASPGRTGWPCYDLAHDEHVRFAKVVRARQHVRRQRRRAARRPRRRPRDAHHLLAPGVAAPTAGPSSRPRAAAARKPVLVLKTGRSEAGCPRRDVAHRGAGLQRRGVVGCAPAGRRRRGPQRSGAPRRRPRGRRPAAARRRPGRDHHEQRRHRGRARRPARRRGPRRPGCSRRRCRSRCARCCRRTPRPTNPVDVTPAWSLFATIYPALVDLLARSGEVDAVVLVLLQRSATDCVDRARCRGCRRASAQRRRGRPGVRVLGRAPLRRRPARATCRPSGVPVLRGRRVPPARWPWPATPPALGIGSRVAGPGDRSRARPSTTPTSTSPTRSRRPRRCGASASTSSPRSSAGPPPRL